MSLPNRTDIEAAHVACQKAICCARGEITLIDETIKSLKAQLWVDDISEAIYNVKVNALETVKAAKKAAIKAQIDVDCGEFLCKEKIANKPGAGTNPVGESLKTRINQYAHTKLGNVNTVELTATTWKIECPDTTFHITEDQENSILIIRQNISDAIKTQQKAKIDEL